MGEEKFNIDCIGDMCPVPVIKAEKELEKMEKGQYLVIKTDHSCTVQSVANHFHKKLGYPCSAEEIDYGIWEISIQKK